MAVLRSGKGIAGGWRWLLTILGLAFALVLAAAACGGNGNKQSPDETLGLPGAAERSAESMSLPTRGPSATPSLTSAPAFAIVPAGYETCTTDTGWSVSFPELWLDPRGCPEMESAPMPLSPDGVARVSIQHLQASAGDNPPIHDAFDGWPAASGLVSPGEVEELEINGLPAVKYTYLSQSSEIETKALVVLVKVEEKGARQSAYAALNLEAPKEEFDRYSAIFEQISRTVRLEGHDDGDFDFEYDYGEQCARLGPPDPRTPAVPSHPGPTHLNWV